MKFDEIQPSKTLLHNSGDIPSMYAYENTSSEH